MSDLAAKYWSRIANEKIKRTDKTGEGMKEEKPKKEVKPKTVKDLLKLKKND